MKWIILDEHFKFTGVVCPTEKNAFRQAAELAADHPKKRYYPAEIKQSVVAIPVVSYETVD